MPPKGTRAQGSSKKQDPQNGKDKDDNKGKKKKEAKAAIKVTDSGRTQAIHKMVIRHPGVMSLKGSLRGVLVLVAALKTQMFKI